MILIVQMLLVQCESPKKAIRAEADESGKEGVLKFYWPATHPYAYLAFPGIIFWAFAFLEGKIKLNAAMNTETLVRATEPVVIEASINAPVFRVWKAITDKNEMKHWHFNVSEFKADAGFEFKIAGKRGGRDFPISCKIIEVKDEETLSFTWSYDEFPAETIVTFELKREGNGTLLRLTHKGLNKIPPVDRDISIENHADGWSHIVGKLVKDYVERKATLFVIKAIDIDASPERVWDVLTKPGLTKEWIREWWPDLSALESDWKQGSTVQWKVTNGEIGADGNVSVCQPFTLLRFSFIVTDPLRQEDVTYRLRERDGRTNLTVTIGNFGDTPDHELCYPGAVDSWDKSLPKIKEMAESGLPDR